MRRLRFSTVTAAAAWLVVYDTERGVALRVIATDHYARRNRIHARRVSLRLMKADARVFALQKSSPFFTRLNDAAHLQLPVQRMRRCAQLMRSNASAAA